MQLFSIFVVYISMEPVIKPAQIIISLVPIVGIVMGAVILFFYVLWHHHEVKLQIKTGVFVPYKFDYKAISLLTGLLLVGVGFVITIVFFVLDRFSYSILCGLIPFAVGVCLLFFYKLYPGFHEKDKGEQGDGK